MSSRPVPVLVGVTASGKTAVSLPLAESLDAEIVSVDSRQIYRGMEIGSAAPTAAERARVPHHLVAEVEPERVMSAGEFGREVERRIGDIQGRGRTPLLVGGSGLYLRAALGGLDEELPSDPDVREALRRRVERDGVMALYVDLAAADPATAEGVSPRDAQRITRALEILELTGRPPSELRTMGRETRRPARIVVLDREPEDLLARIRERVEGMVDAGLEREVLDLLARGLPQDLPALRSVGYAETIDYLNGEMEREDWIELIVRNTRRFAKRQRTWFRALAGAVWITVPPGEGAETTAGRAGRLLSGEADPGMGMDSPPGTP